MGHDPIELEVFKNIFHSIAEEMGAALRRTAFSPNIKERRDYSCAVFDGGGCVIAMGDHMPVHLGSMPMSVAAAVCELDLGPGDMDTTLRNRSSSSIEASQPITRWFGRGFAPSDMMLVSSRKLTDQSHAAHL